MSCTVSISIAAAEFRELKREMEEIKALLKEKGN